MATTGNLPLDLAIGGGAYLLLTKTATGLEAEATYYYQEALAFPSLKTYATGKLQTLLTTAQAKHATSAVTAIQAMLRALGQAPSTSTPTTTPPPSSPSSSAPSSLPPSSTTTPAASSTLIGCAAQTLRQGSQGTCVKVLQQRLNQLDNAGLALDGVFGPLTAAAVKQFQANQGATVNGIVGSQDWGLLEHPEPPSRTTVPFQPSSPSSTPSSNPPPSTGETLHGIPVARPATLALQANGLPYGWFQHTHNGQTYFYPAIPPAQSMGSTVPQYVGPLTVWWLGLGQLYARQGSTAVLLPDVYGVAQFLGYGLKSVYFQSSAAAPGQFYFGSV